MEHQHHRVAPPPNAASARRTLKPWRPLTRTEHKKREATKDAINLFEAARIELPELKLKLWSSQ